MFGGTGLRILAVGLAIVATLVLADAASSPREAAASHSGGMDAMWIDMDPDASPANTGTSFGSIEFCAQMFENDVLDGDEDSTDTIRFDVIADNIPASNPAIGTNFVLHFPTPDFEVDQTSTPFATFTGWSILNAGDTVPQDDGDFQHAIVDVASNGVSGSGPISGLELLARDGAADGFYPLTLEDTAHIDTLGNPQLADFASAAGVIVGPYPSPDPCLDSDGDVIIDGADNCPSTANANQVDTDGDSEGDACDANDDGDFLSDAGEAACGSDPLDAASVPERIDGDFAGVDDDGDTLVDEALPAGAEAVDCDGDGYTGALENYVYSYVPQATGDQKTCQEYDLAFPNPNADIKPSLRWPSDINKTTMTLNSFNKIDALDVTSFLAPVRYIGTDVGTNPGDVRFDLTPGAGIFPTDINVNDITALLAGPTTFPPMLGGVKAFRGPVCPWAP